MGLNKSERNSVEGTSISEDNIELNSCFECVPLVEEYHTLQQQVYRTSAVTSKCVPLDCIRLMSLV